MVRGIEMVTAGSILGFRRLRDDGALPIRMRASMPLFFFDVSDGRCAADANGLEFADERAARREALRRAAMLLKTSTASSKVVRKWRIDVKDEEGSVLFWIDSGLGVAPGAP